MATDHSTFTIQDIPDDGPVNLEDEAGSLCAAIVLLTRGQLALIDERDEQRVSVCSWCFHHSGYALRVLPRTRNAEGKRIQKMISMHRFILDDPARSQFQCQWW